MNRHILLLLSLFTVTLAFSQQKQYKVVVAGFYNLENLFDTIDDPKAFDEDFTPNGSYHYTGEIYKDKLQHLEEVISQIGTDISPDGLAFWGTAEVENKSVLQDLAALPKLKSRNYQAIHYNGGDPRGIDCAFMYNPKYFKPLYSTSIPIDLSKAVKEGKPTRDVLWVTGMLNATDTIHIFVGHWPSRRGGEELTAPMRDYVAQTIKTEVDSLMKANPNTKVIVMGDLNDNPTDRSLTEVLDCVDKKEKCSLTGLFNPWVAFYKKGIGTLAHNDAWGLFDQIILSGAWLNANQSGYFFQKANIFSRDFMIQKTGKYKGYPKRTWDFNIYNAGYSDHFPTYITLLKEIKP